MTPTTMETAAPGFALWCPTFGPLDSRGDPLGLAFQCTDNSDPLAEAEQFAVEQGLWGYLHRVEAGGGGGAVCRVPEHPEDAAAGKPRCFAGLQLVRGSGGKAATVRSAAVRLATPGETVTWDADRQVLDRRPVLLDDSQVENLAAVGGKVKP